MARGRENRPEYRKVDAASAGQFEIRAVVARRGYQRQSLAPVGAQTGPQVLAGEVNASAGLVGGQAPVAAIVPAADQQAHARRPA